MHPIPGSTCCHTDRKEYEPAVCGCEGSRAVGAGLRIQACADRIPPGAYVFNLHGESVAVDKIAQLINQHSGGELITYGGPPIPIAPSMNDAAIRRVIGPLPSTSLEDGVRETMQRFAALRDSGRLDTSDIDA